MVRVVSQSFNHPRSRHSSGETDLDLAQRADSALSTLRSKRTDLADYESSSDSFWDSEFDMDQQDQQLYLKGSTEDEINGNETPEKSDVFTKRKERRRERNKVSAQAYRQRRRQVNVSTQQELSILEEKNRHLMKQKHDLELKIEEAKQILKGQQVSAPSFLFPANSNVSTTSSVFVTHEPQMTNATASDESLSSSFSSLSASVNNNSPNWGTGNFVQNNSQYLNGNDSSMNANLPTVSPINLNTLGNTTVSPVSNPSLAPSLSPGAGPLAAKPKQNFFNANHCYKIQMHHPKVLRTVHEIPSNVSNEEEESYHLTITNQPRVSDFSSGFDNGEKASCDEYRINNNNGNMNLINMNERLNSNLLTPKEDSIWNGAFHMKALKAVDMNDNANSAHSQPHFHNNPHQLLHPNNNNNNGYQFIITAEENRMPPQ